MVRVKGLEPPRQRRQNLNLVRLPVPPHPHCGPFSKAKQRMREKTAFTALKRERHLFFVLLSWLKN